MDSPLPNYNPDPEKAPGGITPQPIIKPPSPRQQQWGAVISIVVIVLMILVGAFYVWGKRIAENRNLIDTYGTSTIQY